MLRTLLLFNVSRLLKLIGLVSASATWKKVVCWNKWLLCQLCHFFVVSNFKPSELRYLLFGFYFFFLFCLSLSLSPSFSLSLFFFWGGGRGTLSIETAAYLNVGLKMREIKCLANEKEWNHRRCECSNIQICSIRGWAYRRKTHEFNTCWYDLKRWRKNVKKVLNVDSWGKLRFIFLCLSDSSICLSRLTWFHYFIIVSFSRKCNFPIE